MFNQVKGSPAFRSSGRMATPTSGSVNREAWYGSPVAAGLDTDNDVTATITFNERTIADLSRMVGYAAADNIATTLGYAGFDFVDAVEVTDLELYGSDQVIVGRNSPHAALPLRGDRFVGKCSDQTFNLARLGKLPFASSDTIAATIGIRGTNIEASCGIAVPGSTNLKSDSFRPTKPPQILGEGGGAEIAAALPFGSTRNEHEIEPRTGCRVEIRLRVAQKQAGHGAIDFCNPLHVVGLGRGTAKDASEIFRQIPRRQHLPQLVLGAARIHETGDTCIVQPGEQHAQTGQFVAGEQPLLHQSGIAVDGGPGAGFRIGHGIHLLKIMRELHVAGDAAIGPVPGDEFPPSFIGFALKRRPERIRFQPV